ncbi:Virulence protein [uncultured Eubacterium sp.]|nr:Virulence protein [uncultured Eubacterium sp.]
MKNDFQFLIYNTPSDDISVNAVIKDESIWLTQKAMAELFGVKPLAISKHLKNIFTEGELDESMVRLLTKYKQARLSFIIWMRLFR